MKSIKELFTDGPLTVQSWTKDLRYDGSWESLEGKQKYSVSAELTLKVKLTSIAQNITTHIGKYHDHRNGEYYLGTIIQLYDHNVAKLTNNLEVGYSRWCECTMHLVVTYDPYRDKLQFGFAPLSNVEFKNVRFYHIAFAANLDRWGCSAIQVYSFDIDTKNVNPYGTAVKRKPFEKLVAEGLAQLLTKEEEIYSNIFAHQNILEKAIKNKKGYSYYEETTI